MKNYIGRNKFGELVVQKLDINGLIKGFDTYYPIEIVNGDFILEHCGSNQNETIVMDETLDHDSKVVSGMLAMPSIELPDYLKDAYTGYTVCCVACSESHNSDDSSGPDATWAIINDCEAICLGCRTADQVMTLVESPDDVFKSKNLADLDLKGYKEIDELFCDSSGFGSVGERALTKDQCRAKMAQIILEHGEVYTGITGIGQFQVYITVYKKVKTAAKKPAKAKKTNKKRKVA